MRYFLIILFILSSPFLSVGQWNLKSLGTTTDLNALDYSNANNIWIAGNTDVYVSSNGGTSFSTVTPKDNNSVNLFGSTFKDFHSFSSTTAAGCGMMYTGNNHAIPRTINGGLNWTWSSISTSFMAIMFDLDFPTPTIGYCVGRDGRLEKSTDAGVSWSPQVSNTTEFIYAVKFFDALNGIAVGYHVILTTSNGGTTWTPHPINSYLKSLDIRGTNTAIAIGDSSNGEAVIMKTTNAGSTWTHINNPFHEAEDVRIFGTDTIILATPDNLYRSVDGGLYWDEYITPPTNSRFYKIDFLNSQNGFAIGTSGYCIYTNNGGTVRPFTIVSASSSGLICQGSTVNFTNSSKPTYNFSWYYDGNLVNTNYNFSQTFNTAGSHTVMVVASDGANTDTSSFTLDVTPTISLPALQIDALIDSMCYGTATGVEIYNTDPTVSYQLRKGSQVIASANGNGSTLTLNTGSVNVTTVYNVRAYKSNQCFSDSAFAYDSVIVVIPDNSLTIIPDKPLYCYTDSAFVIILNSQSWVNYSTNSQFNPSWHGNGDTLIIPYGIPGNGSHDVYVYAKSDFGCQTNMSNHATIIGQIGYAHFIASTWSVVQGDSIIFNNTSDADSFQWSFGNGASLLSSTDSIPPPITYNTVGTSTVQLIAQNIAGCVDTFSSEITVVNPVLSTPLTKCMSGILPGKYFVNDYYVDRSGNSYLTGYYYFDYYQNKNHFFAAKLDANQNLIWVKEENYDFWLKSTYGSAIIADDSGNTYVCGNFHGDNFRLGNFTLNNPSSSAPDNGFIIKYDPNGVEQWLISGQQGVVYFGDMVIDSLSNIYISGMGSGSNFELTFADGSVSSYYSENFILIIDTAGLKKDYAPYDYFNPNGSIRCSQDGGASVGCWYAVGPKLKVLRNGKVALAGTTPHGHTKIFGADTLINNKASVYYAEYEMNNDWTKAFIIAEAKTMNELQAFDVDHNGNIYVTGKAQDTLYYDGSPVVLYNEPFRDFTESYIIKCDSTGSSKYLTHTRFGLFHDLDVKSDDHIILTAELYKSGAFKDASGYDYGMRSKGDNDYSLIEYDENGNFQWAQQFGSDSIDFPYYTQLDQCDDAYVCSSINRSWSDWPNIWYCTHPCPMEGLLEVSKISLDGNCNKVNCVPSASLLPNLSLQTLNPIALSGDIVTVDVVAGDASNMVDTVYGISFDVSYPPSLIVPGSISVNYPPSFLGIDGVTTATTTNIGSTISGSVVRNTGTDTSGYGTIATITFRIVPGSPSGSLINLNFSGYYSHMLNNDSVFFNLYGESIFINSSVGVTEKSETTFKIYPNPAQNNITIESQFSNGEVEIINCMGVLCLSKVITHNKEEISLENLSNGIYFVSIRNKENMTTERLVIVR